MASKRVKELEQKVTALEQQIRRLENMHARIVPRHSLQSTVGFLGRDPFETYVWEGKEGSYCDRQLTAAELRTRVEHPLPKQVDYRCLTNVPASAVETDRISKVTFEELARLVIDGAPIRREEKVVSKRISEYTEDTTTRITIPE